MPNELKRVRASYDNLEPKIKAVVSELDNVQRNWLTDRDHIAVLLGDLAEALGKVGAKTANDPRAANNADVKRSVKLLEQKLKLAAEGDKDIAVAQKKAEVVRAELVKLQKDVLAVTKAKSGFFTRSKSLPDLKKLSVSLANLADELKTASTFG